MRVIDKVIFMLRTTHPQLTVELLAVARASGMLPRAILIALSLTLSMRASAEARPSVRFDVSMPGAQAEQIERDFVNVVEQRLQARAGIFQIRSTAWQFGASIHVVFEKAPTCAELAQVASIVDRAVPKGASTPKQRLEDLECQQ